MRLRDIDFPRPDGQRYYETHYRFLARLASTAGVRISFVPMPRKERGFEIRAEDTRILVDFGDHHQTAEDLDEFNACFRYHYSDKRHADEPKTYPLTPISFYDWRQYWKLASTLRYTGKNDMILNNQRPGAAAKVRRTVVQKILRKEYGDKLDTSITDKLTFWRKVERCLVAVCVPGARNDILDRGQLQYWALGACTISPRIDIRLPWRRKPQPGLHYVACADDYSDLLEKIEWCREHRSDCRRIGASAKALFQRSCTPQPVWEWIENCTGG